MDDLSAMLTQLLESPDGMDKIKSLASSLMGSQTNASAAPEQQSLSSSSLPALNPQEISTIMTLVKALKNDQNDERANLLLALRPHLKEERRHKVDEAVKLLKLISLAPLIQKSGLF